MRPWYFLVVMSLPWAAKAAAPVQDPDVGIQAGSPGAAFNNDRYHLGFDVYLKSGDLQAAFQVARKALQARPDDKVWLKSFAQVAEWTAQPSVALDAWVKLARLSNDRVAWDAVGRLAPSLLDDEAFLAYQQQALRRQPGDEVLIKSIAQLYERLGRVDDGLAFFAQLAAGKPSQLLLETEATMAEHTGHDEQARQLLNRLNQQYGPREDWLLRVAAISYLQGNQIQAWGDLHAAAATMPGTAAGYWQTYALLSTQLGKKDDAQKAYQVLVDTGKASASDLMEYVVLLENEDGLAAARLSETLYRSYHVDSAMITAMFLYQREHQPMAAQALLSLPTPEQMANLEQNPDFLEQRGQLEWQQRKYSSAYADFALGLKLRPGNPQLLLDLVSLASDQSDTGKLGSLLPDYGQRASVEPTLWLAWANGWNQMNQPLRALPFQQAYCRLHPDDLFALLTLADIYAKAGDVVVAERLRHRVAVAAKSPGAAVLTPERTAALNDALLRLRLERVTPDVGMALLKARYKQSAGGKLDPATRDLILGWLLAQGSEERARAWMNRTYHGDAPVWAQVSVANTSEDEGALLVKVMQPDGAASDADRSEMTTSLTEKMGWTRQNENTAFDAQERNPDSELALATEGFDSTSRARSASLELQADALQQSALSRYASGVAWAAPLNTRWQLAASADAIVQHSSELDQLGKPPSGNRENIETQYQEANSSWVFNLTNTTLLKEYLGAALGQQYQAQPGSSLYWRAEYNADAPESAPLLAIGAKNLLKVGFNQSFSGPWFVGGGLQADSFHTQANQSLGEGEEVNVEMGRHFTFLALDQTVTLMGMQAHFKTARETLAPDIQALIPPGQVTTAAFFMPTSFNQVGLYWAFGEPTPAGDRQRWSPYGELGANYANTSGAGLDAAFGMHGSVLGGDMLKIGFAQGKSGQDSGSTIRRASLTYQYFY